MDALKIHNLVIPNNIACDSCDCMDPLVPYKESEPNSLEPDRLICPKCNKEFAIDMRDRTFKRLIDNIEIMDFYNAFSNVY